MVRAAALLALLVLLGTYYGISEELPGLSQWGDVAFLALPARLAKAGVRPADVGEVVFGNDSGPAEASNVGRVIALRSGVPHDRIAHEYARATVLVLPSRGQAEGLGLVLAEALLCGTAVVATRAQPAADSRAE